MNDFFFLGPPILYSCWVCFYQRRHLLKLVHKVYSDYTVDRVSLDNETIAFEYISLGYLIIDSEINSVPS